MPIELLEDNVYIVNEITGSGEMNEMLIQIQ